MLNMNEEQALDAALKLCRGHYQRAIVTGEARLSGSDLRGRAAKYSGRYAASRSNLLARLTKAGIPWSEIRCAHGLRVLVLGSGFATTDNSG